MPRAIQSVERAIALLRLLGAAGRPLALAELAAALDLPRPTAHGLLATLREEGLVGQDDAARYLLVAELGRLGTPWDRHDLRAQSMNWADALAAGTGCAVYLGVPDPAGPGGVDVVHHVFRPDGSPQRLCTNTVQPLHATAWGLCLLAFAPSSARPLDPPPRWTRRTIVDPVELATVIGETRRRGWATERGGFELGTGGIAVPLRSGGGLTVAALGIGGPVEELFTADGRARGDLLAALSAAATEIAAGLEGTR